jgi:AraC-like DNA-binding protein
MLLVNWLICVPFQFSCLNLCKVMHSFTNKIAIIGQIIAVKRMMMKIDINPTLDGIGMLEGLGKILQTEVKGGKVVIPDKHGRGFVQGYNFGQDLRMMISNYTLNYDLQAVRNMADQPNNKLVFRFQNILRKNNTVSKFNIEELPSVQITTQSLNLELMVPRNTWVSQIMIVIDASYLSRLVEYEIKSPVLQNILENKQPLLFEQFVYASLQKVAEEMISEKVPESFQHFFYKVKAEELICYLLIELAKRQEVSLQSLNTADIKAIYRTRELLLLNLENCPAVGVLSKNAGMSKSKLQRLFKQIFGKSIFNYFQSCRMQEAARLLKMERLSVSETGYRLGFTNLSHFTKTFEEHIGVKPKKYSMH